MIKTDIGIITIAVEHHPAELTTGFLCHFQRFHGEPVVRRERHGPTHWFSCEQVENNGEVRPVLTRPDIGHITALHLIWPGHGELPFKVVRDSNMFMTTTFIPVSRLLTADQPQLFHEPASKPASHLVASTGCQHGMLAGSGRTMADVM